MRWVEIKDLENFMYRAKTQFRGEQYELWVSHNVECNRANFWINKNGVCVKKDSYWTDGGVSNIKIDNIAKVKCADMFREFRWKMDT